MLGMNGNYAKGQDLPRNIHSVKQIRSEAQEEANLIDFNAATEKRELTAQETKQKTSLLELALRCTKAIEDDHQFETFAGGPRKPDPRRTRMPLNLVAPGGDPTGRTQPTRGNGFLSRLMSEANGEEREQIESLIGIMSGRVSASANLTPSGDGGNLIPQFVAGQIEMNVAAFTPVLNASRIFNTEDGAPVVYPVLSDSESAEQLDSSEATGLDDVVSGDTPPTALTGPKLQAYKVSSKPVLIPRETLTDSGLDIAGDILASLVARIARYENLKYTKGNGTTEPQGFLTGCTHYNVSTPLDLDMCLDLTQQVPPLYRPKGVFMASDATIKFLRKLKTGISGDKRPLWSFGDSSGDGTATEGTPTGLWGYPLFVNNDMPDINASTGYIAGHEVAFGDFSRFVIRRAENGLPFVYSWPIPAKDGRALITFRRSDSKLLVPTAIATFAVGGS